MSIIETHRRRNPRLLAFYALLAAMVLLLAGGLAYRQLLRSGLYSERERTQSQRRVVYPGPRGNIFDREGRVLVGNQPRFSVVLNLGELRDEFEAESARFRNQPAATRPSGLKRAEMARAAVVQRYLDRVNQLIGRTETVSSRDIERQYLQARLLPFILLDDLVPAEYARLIERLPVNSPLQVYTSSTRFYPHGPAAAHTLGYVGLSDDLEPEGFPGEDLMTFKMRGQFGRNGLEMQFDQQLQGDAGGQIYLVDHAGFKASEPIEKLMPRQGQNLAASLDIDLQLAAERAIGDKVGAAVALDVQTGEVLVLASKPSYDLNDFVPRLSTEAARQIEQSGAWLNRAIQGQYPPGSTFKVVTAVAGLRSGAIDRRTAHVICPGFLMVGSRRFPCNAREGHGEVDLQKAIAVSCNVFFYKYGVEMGEKILAAEARRFGFEHSTGIELPHEFSAPHVASPEWKRKLLNESWYPGDTANMSIGQGDTLVNPLQVACMVASFARGETETKPTLLHVPGRAPQHSTPIGLNPTDYAAIVEAMEQGYMFGSGKLAKVEGLRAATKTGTAQKGRIDLAWTVAFAPVDNPRIAIAVVMEGQEPDTTYWGGLHAAPVVGAILKEWKDKQDGKSSSIRIAGAP